MKTAMLILFLLLTIGCNVTPPLVCDYESEFKLVAQVNDVVVDGISLNTLPEFSFPYLLQGDSFPWESGTTYNYDPIQADLQNYFPFSTVEFYVDFAGNVRFNVYGLSTAQLETLNVDSNNETTDMDFIKTCY